MIEQIRELVESTCKKKSNYFGYGIWTHHILPVVKYSKFMAKKIGANEEIVEIAALLHDYASVKDYALYADHHVHGAMLAEQILQKYHYPKEKTIKVKECILNHRGSMQGNKLTREALCVADADAMAHFDSIPSLFYLAFNSHKMSIDEANMWVKEKLKRSYKKLSPEAKKIIKDKYTASKKLF